jgi:RNA polymerase sigma-70 factor, ECF subfamily
MVFHRVLDEAFAEDVVSDVYTKMLRSISKFRGESIGELHSWIRSIAYTTMIDALRHESPIISLEEFEWEPGTDSDMSDIDRREKLTEILEYMDTLSERDRTILTLRIWDDLSYEEISAITRESVSNAKKIVSRSLAKI